MSSIRLGTTFSLTLDSNEALLRAEKHLRSVGFEVERGASAQLSARRGNAAWAMVAVSPRLWATTVRVSALPKGGAVEVKTVFEVSTRGQAPSLLEGAFWREEVRSLEQAVREGKEAGGASRRLARLTIAVNLVAIPTLMAVWLAPVAAAVSRAPRTPWEAGDVVTVVAAAVTGLGLAWLVGRYVFGIFIEPQDMPYLKQ